MQQYYTHIHTQFLQLMIKFFYPIYFSSHHIKANDIKNKLYTYNF